MKSNNAFQERLSIRFRRLLSGAADGKPPWLEAVARTDEAGFFLPTDAPWVIHRDFATLVGGIRALLMQAMHPAPLAGVRQHSRYEQDPLGRLSGTIRWLTVTTFASKSEVLREADRVNKLHTRVSGTFQDSSGRVTSYRASEEQYLLWVHVAFMESFLTTHQWYSSEKIPQGSKASGADNYVAQWSRAAEPLGLTSAPQSVAEVKKIIDDLLSQQVLAVSEDTRQVIAFIKNPPLPRMALPIYHLLFEAAVVSLDPRVAAALGLKPKPKAVIVPVTRGLLRLMRWAIGPESPIEDAALVRLRRIGAI